MGEYDQVKKDCRAVLERNSQGVWTQPAEGFYPNQWLWDSAFTAIGYSTYDTQRAVEEVYSLLEGQWENGMLPNMIFRGSGLRTKIDKAFWAPRSKALHAKGLATSGITQPPVIATTARILAGRLPHKEAYEFVRQVTPALIRYHKWLYDERDQDGNGLVTLIHPWETGLDNTPGWIKQIKKLEQPRIVKIASALQLDKVIDRLRPDTQGLDPDQRSETIESLHLMLMIRRLRSENYRPIDSSHPASGVSFESLSFNCILAAANQDLQRLVGISFDSIPVTLLADMQMTQDNLPTALWDVADERFSHFNRATGRIEPVAGISQLLPIYSGTISKRQADTIVAAILDTERFGAEHPLPSVAMNEPSFRPHRYWQGPVWINTNWLVIRGLKRYNFHDEAHDLTLKTIDLVRRSGIYEYYSAIDGRPLGAKNFSWTAALTLDLINDIEG